RRIAGASPSTCASRGPSGRARREGCRTRASRCRRSSGTSRRQARTHGPSLAPLLYESVAAIGVLRDHDKGTILEACLSLQRGARQVVVLMLGRHALAALGLDLRVEAARADAQRHALSRVREELPGVLGDQDPAFANVLRAEAMTVG